MPTARALGEFLASRRAALEPETVGLPRPGTARRVPGLRREEVAALAGVSVDYYIKLEQGRVGKVSDQVLEAVERVLRLDHLEKLHLRALLDPDSIHTPRVPTTRLRARPAVAAMIEAFGPVPAVIHGPHLEVLGHNRAAAALLDDFTVMPPAQRNMARWMFLEPRARAVYRDWSDIASQMVAILRHAAGGQEPTAYLKSLVEFLSTESDEFARMWADYRLFRHTHGVKVFRNELVGELRLNYETLPLPDDNGQTVIVYTADRGSPSAARLLELVAVAGQEHRLPLGS